MSSNSGSSPHDPQPLLSHDAFQSSESQQLFEVIDRLRDSGISRDIELPELVIVGDQSVGKSSLLQSLTDIPFPVASRLCTRFPTRIVSRRTPGAAEAIRISIERDGASSLFNFPGAYNVLYTQFTQERTSMTAGEFQQVMNEAAEVMGLKTSGEVGQANESPSETLPTNPPRPFASLFEKSAEKHFSSDVLKIELSGPRRSHFSIVDVPGVFHTATGEVTNEERDVVTNIVKFYMMAKRSVIVCVADGSNELANQIAFEMASSIDETAERVVGVITKCDVAQDPDLVVERAQNKEKHLPHGWFVVRNRSPNEVRERVNAQQRQSQEMEFFAKHPWTKLPIDRRGVQALKSYLANLLCVRIQEAFPALMKEIEERKQTAATELEKLGPSRAAFAEKQAYLASLAQKVHSAATRALDGHYTVVASKEMKLRMLARNANEAFASGMEDSGHSVPFETTVVTAEPSGQTTAPPSYSFGELDKASIEELRLMEGQRGQAHSSAAMGFGSWMSEPLLDPKPASTSNGFRLGPSPTRATSDDDANANAQKPPSSFSKVADSMGSNSGIVKKDDLFGPLRARNSTLPPSQQNLLVRNSSPFTTSQSASSTADQTKPKTLLGFYSLPPFPTPSSCRKVPSSSTGINEWIIKAIEENRGTELPGTLNPTILPSLFRKQATKWEQLAVDHLSNITTIALQSMLHILKSQCKDTNIEEAIIKVIKDANRDASDRANVRLSELISDTFTKPLQTSDALFQQQVHKARLARFEKGVRNYKARADFLRPGVDASKEPNDELVINLRDMDALFRELHSSTTENLVRETHDILQVYYWLERKKFVENVNKIVVERFLYDPAGPVMLFSPTYVAAFSAERVELLAAEDGAVVAKRSALEQTLKRLSNAEDITRKYS